MKNFNIIYLLLIMVLISSNIFSQEQEMTEGQKAWMEYMTPGDYHKMLATHSGEWKTKTTFWMQPGGEPQISEGSSTNEMIFGGRYLVSKPSGFTFGMPFEGMSLEGYDNATKEFTSIWVDNLGTGTTIAKGKYDDETKMINYTGTMLDPMTKKEISFRETISYSDSNKHVIKMYMVNGDQEFQSMEVVFTKVIK